MFDAWIIATVACFVLIIEECRAEVKNKTGEGHYWGPPSAPHNWLSSSAFVPPPIVASQQGMARPQVMSPPQSISSSQGLASSHGWAPLIPSQAWLPPQNWIEIPSGTPTQHWISPRQLHSISPSASWSFSDDNNVCTLDASILIVLDSPTQTALQDQVQAQQSPYGDRSSKAVRMACADIATTSEQSCKACCKMACRQYGISSDAINGFLINPKEILRTNPSADQVASFPRVKRQISKQLPSLNSQSTSQMSCMCCGPRSSPMPWHNFVANPYSTQLQPIVNIGWPNNA
ncbi:unnamed protein product [Thelazia callipaeda]|uniref:Gnk2-homologous domain-containing protein n=1 Tax=Thelazia callipaeda TaxID=103827 RepID=A0A0N5CJF0_THECL|nr:unnamed protein product [Thelazia callipaeda]